MKKNYGLFIVLFFCGQVWSMTETVLRKFRNSANEIASSSKLGGFRVQTGLKISENEKLKYARDVLEGLPSIIRIDKKDGVTCDLNTLEELFLNPTLIESLCRDALKQERVGGEIFLLISRSKELENKNKQLSARLEASFVARHPKMAISASLVAGATIAVAGLTYCPSLCKSVFKK